VPALASTSPRAARLGAHGDTEVRWLGGGLLVQWRDHGFVLDAPPGVSRALGDRLGAVRAIVLSGGRWQSVGGLVELLCRLGPHRGGVPMDLTVPLGEERGVALAETWVRAWGSAYPLALDGLRPGGQRRLGPMSVELMPVTAGEPDATWERVVPRLQVAVRLATPDATVAWVPGAAPCDAVRRACAEADLAVVEMAVEAWPHDEGRWRMTPTEALHRASFAREVWLAGDDGELLDSTLPEA